MKRRTLLTGLPAAAIAAPRAAGAQRSRVLRFIPQNDLTVLDPVFAAVYATRTHALMVFDTLYGTDSGFRPSPQMVEGHVVEDGGLTWRLTLRDGLKWHDGERVLARDCVASIRRWGQRDPFGQSLLAATAEISAESDKVIRFRLHRRFPMLPDALGKLPTLLPVMMPERLARTDAFTQVTEMVGSGPFRFLANERMAGARAAYARNADYVPRSGGRSEWTAGPKIVHLDRVEWTTINDPATAAAAMQSGEQDWWEYVANDLVPVLRRARNIRVEMQESTGILNAFRMNHLQPPFNNPAIRRALLGAMNQEDFVIPVAGSDPSMWRVPTGFFTPGTPMANDTGMEVLTGPRDYDKVKRDLAAAGYRGERVVLLVATDPAFVKSLGDVAADMLRKAGMNVDVQAMDWGTFISRRASKEPVERGGWSAAMTALSGLDMATPAVQSVMRGNGPAALYGWPDLPKLEALRDQWFMAEDLETQQRLAREIQRQAFEDLPYIPAGQFLQVTAYNRRIRDVVPGYSVFWGLQKVG
jgi:peptide/nickel transport system substrate-binding protein